MSISIEIVLNVHRFTHIQEIVFFSSNRCNYNTINTITITIEPHVDAILNVHNFECEKDKIQTSFDQESAIDFIE